MPTSTTSATFAASCDSAGQLHMDPRVKAQMAAFVRANLRNKPVEVIVRKQVKHRTSPQVAYYFGVLIPTWAQHEGYTRDEHYHLHDGLMHLFWPLEPDKVTKAPRRRRLTLAEHGSEPPLTDEEMGIHIEQCVIKAAERGCIVPDADKGYRVNRERNEKPRQMPKSHRAETIAA